MTEAMVSHPLLPDLVGLRKIAFLQHFAVNYRDIEL